MTMVKNGGIGSCRSQPHEASVVEQKLWGGHAKLCCATTVVALLTLAGSSCGLATPRHTKVRQSWIRRSDRNTQQEEEERRRSLTRSTTSFIGWTCLQDSSVTDQEESTERQLLEQEFSENESDPIVMNGAKQRAAKTPSVSSSSVSSSSSSVSTARTESTRASSSRNGSTKAAAPRQEARKRRSNNGRPSASAKKDESKRKSSCANTRQRSISRGRDPLISLNINLDALAKSGATDRAEELLHRIDALHEEGYYDVKPDTVSWNSVMNGYAQRGNVDQVQRIFSQIETTNESAEKEVISVDPTNGSLNNHTDNSKSQPTTTATASEDKKKGQKIKPSVISFNTLIRAFARSGKEGSAERAEEVIRQMEQLYFRGQAHLGPNTISFNTALDAIAKTPSCQPSSAAQRAEDLLRHMMHLCHEEGIVSCKPDTQSFNTVLHAHALAGAAERAEQLLKHMDSLYEAGNQDVQPDVYSYTTVMNAWASAAEEQMSLPVSRTAIKNNNDERQMKRKRQNDGLAAKKCLALLKLMEEKPSKSASPMDNNSKTDRKPKVVKPNAVTYTSCIKALRYSSNPASPSVAHGLLRRMEKLYGEGDVTMKPDATCFTSVIDCYSIALKNTRNGEMAREASQRVQDLLGRMNELYQTTGDVAVRPTVMTYGSVITTWARSGLPQAVLRVRELMEQMESLHQIRPNTVICNALMDTIARSSDFEKAQNALSVLRGMEGEAEMGTKPDTISYNSVLQAAANSYGNAPHRREVFQVAQDVFGAVRREARPNSVTYFLYLKAIRKLVLWGGGGHDALVLLQQAFQWCCQDGLVSPQVLDQLKAACASEREMLDILQSCAGYQRRTNNSRGRRVQWQDLPAQWRRKA